MCRNSKTTILFIGNSFTARNDLSGLIERVGAARGHIIETRLISAGGASLRAHWNASKALGEIKVGRYNYVVLQEQSTLPIKNPKRMHENVRLFDAAIKDAGSKTALYMTWARQQAPETHQAIIDAYTDIGRELGAMVVPVGVAWREFLCKHDQPVLHDRDQSHPSLAGSYLAACVFLGTLFQENPMGLECEVAGLNEKDRMLLQKTAWRACNSVVKRNRKRRSR